MTHQNVDKQSMDLENDTLNLLLPPPDKKLQTWLNEFYGKPATIIKRELLRHRDLSRVERLNIAASFPDSLIYKAVLPPWDVELDLHERVLVPSITSSPQLYMSAHHKEVTVMFLEDLGSKCLKIEASAKLAAAVGKKLARIHRAYSYRIDELEASGVVKKFAPPDYPQFVLGISTALLGWNLLSPQQRIMLDDLSRIMSEWLANEPVSLVHGDFFAENLIPRDREIHVIDWSWFTVLGVQVMDLATVTMDHFKNGELTKYKDQLIDSYCFESGLQQQNVEKLLPVAEALSRVFFLYWLVVRRQQGIMGTTVGPVDGLIGQVVIELQERTKALVA